MLKEKSVKHRTPRKAVWVHHANTTNLHIYIECHVPQREGKYSINTSSSQTGLAAMRANQTKLAHSRIIESERNF